MADNEIRKIKVGTVDYSIIDDSAIHGGPVLPATAAEGDKFMLIPENKPISKLSDLVPGNTYHFAATTRPGSISAPPLPTINCSSISNVITDAVPEAYATPSSYFRQTPVPFQVYTGQFSYTVFSPQSGSGTYIEFDFVYDSYSTEGDASIFLPCITASKSSTDLYVYKNGAWVLHAKQDKLISGENIKTINGESILGNGDIEVGADIELIPASEFDKIV